MRKRIKKEEYFTAGMLRNIPVFGMVKKEFAFRKFFWIRKHIYGIYNGKETEKRKQLW